MKRLLKEHFPLARFRFQVPIRHYIADFASHKMRIVVEIDGGQHNRDVDDLRTADIQHEGYMVVRFWNNEVLCNGKGCMDRLAQLVTQNHPHPTGPRQQAAKSSYPSPIKGEAG